MKKESQDLIDLIEEDELESIEKEIEADFKNESILKTRDSNQFESGTLESYPDEEKLLSNWFTSEIHQIVRFKIFKLHKIRNNEILDHLFSAEENLKSLYSDDLFAINNDFYEDSLQISIVILSDH